MKFGEPPAGRLQILLIVIGVFVGIFLIISFFINGQELWQFMPYFITSQIPLMIFEEGLFRGLLYVFLRDLRLDEMRSILVQALFFWLAHINYLFQHPVFFWIFIPIISLILVYIVVRTKSLSISSVTHILINFLAVAIGLHV
jgi:membrane protease YdiL (CAAX protease family)